MIHSVEMIRQAVSPAAITAKVREVSASILAWFRPAEHQPEARQEPERTSVTAREEGLDRSSESNSAAYHIGDILGGIEDYMAWIRRLKRFDPDAYDLHSRVGGTILPKNMLVQAGKRDDRVPSDPHKWPAFFMVSFDGSVDDSETIGAKLIYFQKVKLGQTTKHNVIPFPGVIYEGTMFYSARKKALDYPVQFFVGFDQNGRPTLLRQIVSRTQTLPRRSGSISHRKMDYPGPLKELFKDNKNKSCAEKTIDEFVGTIFWLALSGSVAAYDGIQVAVSKSGATGRFGVPIERTSYFFKDRDMQVTVNGARKKIFHAVRQHKRQLKDGRTITVKSHYRGVRRFFWKGYDVCITVPDHHHSAINHFIGSTEFSDDTPSLDGYLSAKEVGKAMRDRIWNGEARHV